jgi:hypothetical protein
MIDNIGPEQPGGLRTIAGFMFGGDARYYGATVRLVADSDGFKIIYDGLGPGVGDPYLDDFWEALASAQVVPDSAPAIIVWPYDKQELLDSPDEFVDDSRIPYDKLSWKLISAKYGVELDSRRATVSGPWVAVARVPWFRNVVSHVIVEIAIGVSAGVTTQATSAILRAGLKKVAKKLRDRRHPVKEIESPEEDDWRPPYGYL